MKILILLGDITYILDKGNPTFRRLKLKAHYEKANEFKKKMNCKVIIGNKYNDLYNFINKIISNEKIIIIYCGHGNINKWEIGISKEKLLLLLNKIDNEILIISDSCYGDSMNITKERKNTNFISSARSEGKDEHLSAYFTCEGGYLSTTFYKVFHTDDSIKLLYDKILCNYYFDNKDDLHLPKLFY